jgi:hypothetical protein
LQVIWLAAHWRKKMVFALPGGSVESYGYWMETVADDRIGLLFPGFKMDSFLFLFIF